MAIQEVLLMDSAFRDAISSEKELIEQGKQRFYFQADRCRAGGCANGDIICWADTIGLYSICVSI